MSGFSVIDVDFDDKNVESRFLANIKFVNIILLLLDK